MKVLCLGNNTEDTDKRTTEIANKDNATNFGLLSNLGNDINKECFDVGYYHTSVYDFNVLKLSSLTTKFDKIIILDQPRDEWDHPNAYYNTIILGDSLPNVEYINPVAARNIRYWRNIVDENKSFCIFPFIELVAYDNYTTVCCRSTTKITQVDKLHNFNNDTNYVRIRDKMLNGDLIPEHCQSCYSLEEKGVISPRIEETNEWCNRLNLLSTKQLKEIKSPAYYEIRPSNKCNLKCRMCTPSSSHLIDYEYSKLGIGGGNTYDSYLSFKHVDIANLHKLYIAGGEPLIIPEVVEFLVECIKSNQTSFEININTNATVLTDKFKEIISNFTNLQFTVSIDGYKNANHYIRYPSKWEDIIDNVDYMIAHNHKVSFNTTISIYNITRLFELFNFIDTKYNGHHLHTQLAGSINNILSPYNNPNISIAMDNLSKSLILGCCQTMPVASMLAELIVSYENHDTPLDMRAFYDFNDKLDRHRKIDLCDYIPELDSFR